MITKQALLMTILLCLELLIYLLCCILSPDLHEHNQWTVARAFGGH